METTAAYITFIHVFIVFILVAQHCCRGIKMLFTNITLDRRMRYAEMFVQFFLCREDGVAPRTGESSWLHIFSFKFVFYRFKNLFLGLGCSHITSRLFHFYSCAYDSRKHGWFNVRVQSTFNFRYNLWLSLQLWCNWKSGVIVLIVVWYVIHGGQLFEHISSFLLGGRSG